MKTLLLSFIAVSLIALWAVGITKLPTHTKGIAIRVILSFAAAFALLWLVWLAVLVFQGRLMKGAFGKFLKTSNHQNPR